MPHSMVVDGISLSDSRQNWVDTAAIYLAVKPFGARTVRKKCFFLGNSFR
jgi:hypothetical protein